MKRMILNAVSVLVILAGGAYLGGASVVQAAPAAIATATLSCEDGQASCGDVCGECCTARAGNCYCGPCEKILPD